MLQGKGKISRLPRDRAVKFISLICNQAIIIYLIYTLFFIKTVAQGLVPNVPYFWTSIDQIVALKYLPVIV